MDEAFPLPACYYFLKIIDKCGEDLVKIFSFPILVRLFTFCNVAIGWSFIAIASHPSKCFLRAWVLLLLLHQSLWKEGQPFRDHHSGVSKVGGRSEAP